MLLLPLAERRRPIPMAANDNEDADFDASFVVGVAATPFR